MGDGNHLVLLLMALLGAIGIGFRSWAWASLIFAVMFVSSVAILADVIARAP